ncbi:hypothetical protein [Botrimarina hoheduenensis]|uniref:Uncharacterized protein n=1 Tax=Botrimarina hoheduenensis TaxID=2528000 RepID=A0A5C5W9M3_9BACT|nr:hypothetical protein [Botrimarina hoheduenensis]TWT46895.1 hypothetical protein Pla111_19970 [Botrimarina hoheduenensis]
MSEDDLNEATLLGALSSFGAALAASATLAAPRAVWRAGVPQLRCLFLGQNRRKTAIYLCLEFDELRRLLLGKLKGLRDRLGEHLSRARRGTATRTPLWRAFRLPIFAAASLPARRIPTSFAPIAFALCLKCVG